MRTYVLDVRFGFEFGLLCPIFILVRRSSSALFLSAATAVFGMQLVSSSTAQAAATCTYTPVMPKRVSVGQSVVELRTPLKIAGPSACSTEVSVNSTLVHGTDSYFLYWDSKSADVESIYAFSFSPGTYRTTAEDCDSYDADYNELSCTVTRTSTVIKYAGRPRLSATRSKSRVTLKVRATRFDDTHGFRSLTTPVSIQRLTGKTWKTIHRATAKGTKGYSWTYTRSAKSRYRAVSAETGSTFAGTSKSVSK